MKNIKIILAISLAVIVLSSCSTSSISKSKFSPYYFYTDTSDYYIEISRYELSKMITFDKLVYKGSYIDDKRMTKEDFDNVTGNRNIENIPSIVIPKVGFTKESLNMRLYPTDSAIHRGNPKFDANQYTRISAFSPVFVLHTSKDTKFYYVFTEFMRGWVPAEKVKIYSEAVFAGVQQMPFIRVIKDNSNIGGVIYGIGDKVPLISQTDKKVIVMTPEGTYEEVEKNDSFVIGNAEYSDELMKKMAESQLNNEYDWGGKEGRRDCSAYVRDLWRVFGAEIPRSSGLQVLVGKKLIGKPESEEEFYSVLKNAKPYKTLIFFKGHVIMYGGMEGDDYIIYHAVSSLLNDNGKKVELLKVAKNKLYEEKFSKIWQRVVRVTEISPLISPELPQEPELVELEKITEKIAVISGSKKFSTAQSEKKQ